MVSPFFVSQMTVAVSTAISSVQLVVMFRVSSCPTLSVLSAIDPPCVGVTSGSTSSARWGVLSAIDPPCVGVTSGSTSSARWGVLSAIDPPRWGHVGFHVIGPVRTDLRIKAGGEARAEAPSYKGRGACPGVYVERREASRSLPGPDTLWHT